MKNSEKIIILFIFFLFSSLSTSSASTPDILSDSILSDNATISVLTFGAANEPHSVWGHTAIRIKDKDQGIDEVYNYGMFDFDAPFFLIKFLRGKLDYSLAHNNYKDIYRYYKYYKRDMYEQVLNLNYNEKLRLYGLLIENYKKENRFYKYDFFFDNCSTRPLHIIEKCLEGKLIISNTKTKKTFRELLDKQIANHQWMDFGIDLIIGAKADKFPTVRQSVFLPPELMKFFSKAKISSKPSLGDMKSNKTVIKKLVKNEKIIFEFDDTGIVLPKLLYPIWIFTFFFLLEIIILVYSYKKRTIIFKWYDKLWFFIAFIGGLLVTFLWFFTDHQATKDNWNFIWINPLFVFVFFKSGKYKSILINLVSILLFTTLIGFSFFPQEMHPAIIPIIGILLLKVSKYGVLKTSFSKKYLSTKSLNKI